MLLILKIISNETTVGEAIGYKSIIIFQKGSCLFFIVLSIMFVKIQLYSGEKWVFLLKLIIWGFYFFAAVVFFKFYFLFVSRFQ